MSEEIIDENEKRIMELDKYMVRRCKRAIDVFKVSVQEVLDSSIVFGDSEGEIRGMMHQIIDQAIDGHEPDILDE